MMKSLFTIAMISLSLFSCSESFSYEKSFKPENSIWPYEQDIAFEFNIADTSMLYSFYLDVEHSVDYPFQNIYTKIKTTYPDQTKKEDILSLELANDLGLWEGKCNAKRCKVRIFLQEKAYFQLPGDYTLALEQYTRRDSLPGLNEIALRIKEVNLDSQK